ncbi:MAG: polysaccharide biosynthesis/export family protein [Pirellulales bacterium]
MTLAPVTARVPRASLRGYAGLALLTLAVCAGCYAPLRSYGVPAANLPETFRVPWRTAAPPLNLAGLTIPPQPDYVLGPGDILEVTLYRLNPEEPAPTIVRVAVMSNGEIQLPMVGGLRVGGLSVVQAQEAVVKAYGDMELIKQPDVSIFLFERSMTGVMVLGEVNAPGAYRLPKYENDVAHALAAAGGLSPNAGLEIEIHRRVTAPLQMQLEMIPAPLSSPEAITPLPPVEECPFGPLQFVDPSLQVLRIPLRGFPQQPLAAHDIVLQPGDLVVVPSRRDEVFFVVGKLSPTQAVRFSVGKDERELGAGYVLPRNREIDVVTAVAMAGYIDPIDSPTTVTVHRMAPDGRPLLILVDLIKARYDYRENLLVAAGDIIYLNPDAAWWSRRTFDRIIPSLFSLSYRRLLGLGGVGSD